MMLALRNPKPWFALLVLSLGIATCNRDRPAPPATPSPPPQNEIQADARVRLITDPVPANAPDAAGVQVR